MAFARERAGKSSFLPGTEPGRQITWLLNRGGPLGEIAELNGLNPLALERMGTSSIQTGFRHESPYTTTSNRLTIVFAKELIQSGIVGPDQSDSHWDNLQTLLRQPNAPELGFSAQITTEAYARARSDEKRGDSSTIETYAELAKSLGVRRVTAPDVRTGERLIDGISTARPVLDSDQQLNEDRMKKLVTEFNGLDDSEENRRGQIVNELMTAVGPIVLRYCRARIGKNNPSSISAEDITQEVMISVIQALPGYTDMGKPFLAFVYGIAAKKVVDGYRVISRSRLDLVADVPEDTHSDGPQEATLLRESTEELASKLGSLPPQQRDILIFRFVEGLSTEETAEAVGSTPGAVRVAQHRALTRLRQAFETGTQTSEQEGSGESLRRQPVGNRRAEYEVGNGQNEVPAETSKELVDSNPNAQFTEHNRTFTVTHPETTEILSDSVKIASEKYGGQINVDALSSLKPDHQELILLALGEGLDAAGITNRRGSIIHYNRTKRALNTAKKLYDKKLRELNGGA